MRPILKKTPYELWMGRKTNIGYFHIFGYKCFIPKNGKENLAKFDSRSDEDIFVEYSNSNKGCKVYNKRTLVIEESMHIVFNESNNSCLRNDEEYKIKLDKQTNGSEKAQPRNLSNIEE